MSNDNSNITPFTPRQRVRDLPDNEHVVIMVKDGKPEKWFRYSASFDFAGASFSFHIWALNDEDAARRVEAIRATAKLDGQVFATVPHEGA